MVEAMSTETRATGLAILLLAGTAGGVLHTAGAPWVHVFDQVDHDGLFGALPVDDGRSIVVGATGYRHMPPYRGDALIMFVDLTDGSVIRERTWGGDGFDQAWDVAPAPGAGFYVFGETDSWGAGDRDFFLLRLDARGEDEWFRTYGTPKREWPFGMLTLANGDLLLYGRTESETGDEDPYAVRVDPTGEVVWTYVDRAAEPAIVLDAIETPAGDIVLATSVGEDPGLTFLDQDGKVRGARRFEIPGWQYASGIEAADDGYLLAGFSMTGDAGGRANVWLAGVSVEGELRWQKSFGDEASDDYGTTLLRLSDGSYVIGGMGPGLPLWTVDASGRILGTRRVAGEGVYAAFGLVELPDHGLLVSGVEAVVSARSFDAVLARTAATYAPETEGEE